MKNKGHSNNLLHEALVFLIVVMVLVYICRLWPLLLLGILCIFAAVIAIIIRSFKENTDVEPEKPKQPPVIKPVSENDVRRLAYGVILRRITELLLEDFPDARWVWEEPNTMRRIEEDKEIYILLNRAGGHRRAKVIIRNLSVIRLEYGNVSRIPCPEDVQIDEPNEDEDMTDNYEVIAFEWVEAHIIELNERCNEAIGEGLKELLLKADELPVTESWPDICRELQRADISEVKCIPEGIKINLLQ